MIDIAIEWRFTQQVFNLCGCNLLIVRALFDLALEGNLTEGFVYLFLQLTHTTLTGIALDNHFDGSFIEGRLQSWHTQSCVVELTRYQVTLRDFYLFLCDIATYLDNFHTVE